MAKKPLAKVHLAQDPRARRRALRAQAALTFGSLIDRYLAGGHLEIRRFEGATAVRLTASRRLSPQAMPVG